LLALLTFVALCSSVRGSRVGSGSSFIPYLRFGPEICNDRFRFNVLALIVGIKSSLLIKPISSGRLDFRFLLSSGYVCENEENGTDFSGIPLAFVWFENTSSGGIFSPRYLLNFASFNLRTSLWGNAVDGVKS
jgi:hypothetical protein